MTMATALTADKKVELLTDYIMKWCLWQFHSRAWDRERQNEGILRVTTQLLCDEPVDTSAPSERCYYVDAFVLNRDWREQFDWLDGMTTEEKKVMMAALKEHIDFLTIKGSLNKELTDPLY